MSASLSRLAAFHGHLGGTELLKIMIREEFAGRIALFSSFGADAALLVAMVAEIDPATPVLFLETHKHFPETLEYVETLRITCGLKDIRFLTPDPELVNRLDPNGDLWRIQPNRCCWMRKVEPLQRELPRMGIEALITGRKRYQTHEREGMATIELDEQGVFRINPLADFSREDIQAEFARRALPRHPLLAKGYRSIGCAPCTRPVNEGEDERAGRWAHTAVLYDQQKTECGIHLPSEQINWDL